ncbi:MAG: hypothetical protein SVR81_09045 [Chloroflexota bacterium]|nr:hypothetical protein [Chloroflexota bacterium]
MFVLFKKRIAVETSSEEVTRITTILDQNQIDYELRTRRERGLFGNFFDAQSYARANISMYKGSARPAFIYMIYVKRRDVERAQHFAWGD